MCGISGIIACNRNDVSASALTKMTDTIVHRGPDGEGYWISDDGHVGLGHRRLSIIDLSHAADQPMHYMSRYTIIFNGEIYNYIELKDILLKQGYAFKTASDTEVLLALYDRHKENCLQLLDGMFSLVIYDDREKEIFAARDRFGEKPFFYSYEPGKHFIFGSEMKALWAAGVEKKVNNRMLYNYLTHGYLENPDDLSETFYSNCTRLVHMHYLRFSVKDFTITGVRQYFDIDPAVRNNNISEKQAEEKFSELFYTSVKRRLRSDVTVGSSLSGGLDSSLIVCIIDELKRGTTQVQKTFSARFPGFKKDEGRFIEMITGVTNTESHYVFPDETGLTDHIDTICFHQEEPFGSASIYAQYCVMQSAKENNVTVLLDGQGADEYLAGYHSFYTPYFNDLRINFPEYYKSEYQGYKSLHSENSINGVLKKDLKYFIRSRVPRLIEPLKNSHAYYKQKSSPFFAGDFYDLNRRENFSVALDYKDLNVSLHQSILHSGLQVLLRYADRNSMAHSREVRLPFLYHELVEFVFSLPPHFKIHNGWTKWIMRKAFKNLLPEPIQWRIDKIGYEPPQKSWMESSIFKDKIFHSKEKLIAEGILDPKTLLKKPKAYTAIEKGDKSWEVLMAGMLFK